MLQSAPFGRAARTVNFIPHLLKKAIYSLFQKVVTRSDRVKLQFQGVGNKLFVPHDLSHFIIEIKLNMRREFWGCVDSGGLFPGMNII